MDVSVIMMPVTLMTAGGAASSISGWRCASAAVAPGRKRQHRRWRQRAADLPDARQANFVEYAPFILILIGLIELTTGTRSGFGSRALPFLSPVSRTRGMGRHAGRADGGTLVTLACWSGSQSMRSCCPSRPKKVKSAPVESVCCRRDD